MLAAATDPNGAYVLLFVVAAVVVLWPLYRWALRGLGYFFLVFGAVGLAISLIEGSALTQPAMLLLGGVLLRLVTSRQGARRHDRRGRTRNTAARAAVGAASGES